MKMKITDAVISSHMPQKGMPRTEITDTSMPGLSVRLQDGKGVWTYRTPRLPDGTRPRVELGYWPAMKAAEARTVAQQEKQKARTTGKTTNVERREAVAKAKARQTLSELAETYYKVAKNNTDEENRNVKLALEENDLGNLAPTELTIKHVKMVANSPKAATKRFGGMSRYFDHLVEDEDQPIVSNPFKMLSNKKKPKPPAPRTGKFGPSQLQAIWHASDDLPEPFNQFVKFDMLALLRRSEAASILAEWINDDGVLTVPGKIMKNGEPYELPLGPMTLEVLGSLPESGPVFPSRKTGRPICGWKTLVRFFQKLGFEEHAGLHFFRRTAASQLGETGQFSVDVVDGILAHRQSGSRPGIIATYNQSVQMAQRQQALLAWEEMVRHAIEHGTFPKREKDNVIKLRAG